MQRKYVAFTKGKWDGIAQMFDKDTKKLSFQDYVFDAVITFKNYTFWLKKIKPGAYTVTESHGYRLTDGTLDQIEEFLIKSYESGRLVTALKYAEKSVPLMPEWIEFMKNKEKIRNKLKG